MMVVDVVVDVALWLLLLLGCDGESLWLRVVVVVTQCGVVHGGG
jgi:hypothetical protein